MNWGRALALVIVAEDLIVATAYFLQKDYKHAIFWFAGGISLLAVTV